MATSIPLHQRTELPPARAGIAKPPYALAAQPEAQFGQTLAKFGGVIFDKLIKAQAANEEAEARGQVETFIEGFNTFVAGKPNASPEELQREWDKVSARIKALPGTLKTGIAKANFTNFLALNEGLINQRAQTSMEAIKSKQELGRFNASREQAMTNFDIPGLTTIYEAQFESGLLDEETGRIQLENDIAVIEEAEKKQGKDALLETVAEAARTMPLEDALYYINVIPRTDITETERNGLIAQRKRQEEIQIEETGRQMLIDFWDGKLTDPDSITRAFAADLISETKAKALRQALLNPEPPKTDLKTYAGVKKVINDIGRGTVNIDQALEVIYGSLDKLDPTTGKSLVDKIFGAHDKNDAEMLKEGRDLMEELIRDKDPISGMFTDDERQILGTAEAILMFDSAIEKAARAKKELTGKDFLIEAIYIGRRIKSRITKEKEAKTEPTFRFGGEAEMERRFETVSPDIEEVKKKHPEIWKAAQKVAEEGKFNPEGTDYDYVTAREAGLKPDKAGHWGSLDPRTGIVLKGRKHPTWDLMVEEEERLGHKIVKKGKRYYSVKEAKIDISDIPEPKTKDEFINMLRRLKVTDEKKGREYYNKYLDKFW